MLQTISVMINEYQWKFHAWETGRFVQCLKMTPKCHKSTQHIPGPARGGWVPLSLLNYHQTSSISRPWIGNTIVDHSHVVRASPVGAAPTISEWSTLHVASIEWAETTARWDETHLSVGIWTYTRGLTVSAIYKIWLANSAKSSIH